LTVLDIHKEECPKEFSEKYVYDVPVVHLNDQFLMQHRVPEESLLDAIRIYKETGKINPKYK
jgi:pyruvate/2-oxoacid:ferredoxin oxidoreductase alpha subunit